MNSLTKKSLFFLVFSIVCNSTITANECIENVHKMFLPNRTPHENFEISMIGFSEKVLSSMEQNNLIGYYQAHDPKIPFVISPDGTISPEPPSYSGSLIDEVLSTGQSSYAELTRDEVLNPVSHKIIDYFQSIVYHNHNNFDFSQEQKSYSTGYFKSLMDNIDNIDPKVKKTIRSPTNFCNKNYGRRGHSEKSYCYIALRIMLNLADLNETTGETFNNMTGLEALKYCYLNLTIHNISIRKFFPESESPSYVQNYLNLQTPKFQQMVIDMMNHYFRHMIKVGNTIDTFYEMMDPKIFPTVEEYCQNNN